MSTIPINSPEELVKNNDKSYSVVEVVEVGVEPLENLKVMLCVVKDIHDNYYGLSYLASEIEPVRYSNFLREIELKDGQWCTKE